MTKSAFGRLLLGLSAVPYGIVLLLGCGSQGSVGDTTANGGGGSGPVNINLNAGTVGTVGGAAGTSTGAGGSSEPSSSAGTCGTTTTDTTRADADVLIVLDRTESMNESLDGSGGTTRLTAIVPAVGEVVANNPGIHWGLELFTTPGGGQCVVEAAPQVPISADSASAINQVLSTITTEQSTPTALALKVATDYLKTVNDGNSKAILLATDGEPNCGTTSGGRGGGIGGTDLVGASAAAAAALAAGFPVYVIGIGPSLSNLNQLAQAGGTEAYYPATSTAELGTALANIAKVISSTCTFKANTAPPDASLVYVYVDKALVAKSDSNGWTFDPSDRTSSTIKLTGSYCDDLLAGVTTQVQIVFGCPNVAPPPVIP